ATPIKALTPNFAAINFNDRTSVLSTAKAFEDLGVAAYNGAGQYIQSATYLYIAGKIVSVEARHAAIIRDLVTEGTFIGNDVATITTASMSSVTTNNAPANSSLERAMSPTEVVNIANTFLADGSKLDVSGLK
ncbi:ferritin-like domain-containing protein, partial [Hymenobacter arcticus]